MIEGLVSVVVPIYNVDKYLERCIKSIVSQTYKNLEIILVDDGSPDNCPAMCDEWAKKDARIRVIHKENAGLGMARNSGMDVANGQYICFLDSDDYIEDTLVEKAINNANGADVVLYGHGTVDKDGNVTGLCEPKTIKNCYENSEVITECLPGLFSEYKSISGFENICMNAWSCLFSMSLIRESNWRWFSEREYISEDVSSLLVLYKNVKKVVIISDVLYYYCANDNSLSKAYRADLFPRIKACYEKMVILAENLDYSPQVFELLKFWFYSAGCGAIKAAVRSNEKIRPVKVISDIICDEKYRNILCTMNFANEPFKRKVLYYCIRSKCALAVYALTKIQMKIEG